MKRDLDLSSMILTSETCAKLYYLLPIPAKDNETPAADPLGEMPAADDDEAEKLDEAAGVSNVGNEVEVATENPEVEDEEEDDDDEWLAEQEEIAFQVLFRLRLTSETFWI